MSVFAQLRSRAGDAWDRAQDHPFVLGIADGSLPQPVFVHYLAQDYVYCLAFSRACLLAAGRCTDDYDMRFFKDMAAAVLDGELETHRQYCARFGLSADDLARTAPAPTCAAYNNFMLATAALEAPIVLLAALAPCAIGYAEIGARLLAGLGQSEHPYREWIATYGGAEYQQFAADFVARFDAMAEPLNATPRDALYIPFELGCQYEWLFWEMAWTQQRWPL